MQGHLEALLGPSGALLGPPWGRHNGAKTNGCFMVFACAGCSKLRTAAAGSDHRNAFRKPLRRNVEALLWLRWVLLGPSWGRQNGAKTNGFSWFSLVQAATSFEQLRLVLITAMPFEGFGTAMLRPSWGLLGRFRGPLGGARMVQQL